MSRLHQLLSTLTPEEKRRLPAWLDYDANGQDSHHVQFLEAALKHDSVPDAWKAAFPNKPYTAQKANNQASRLADKVVEFLTVEAFRKDPMAYPLQKAYTLRRRLPAESFFSEIKAIKGALAKETLSIRDYSFHRLILFIHRLETEVAATIPFLKSRRYQAPTREHIIRYRRLAWALEQLELALVSTTWTPPLIPGPEAQLAREVLADYLTPPNTSKKQAADALNADEPAARLLCRLYDLQTWQLQHPQQAVPLPQVEELVTHFRQEVGSLRRDLRVSAFAILVNAITHSENLNPLPTYRNWRMDLYEQSLADGIIEATPINFFALLHDLLDAAERLTPFWDMPIAIPEHVTDPQAYLQQAEQNRQAFLQRADTAIKTYHKTLVAQSATDIHALVKRVYYYTEGQYAKALKPIDFTSTLDPRLEVHLRWAQAKALIITQKDPDRLANDLRSLNQKIDRELAQYPSLAITRQAADIAFKITTNKKESSLAKLAYQLDHEGPIRSQRLLRGYARHQWRQRFPGVSLEHSPHYGPESPEK